MGSYLDGAGLTQVWGKLKDKIDTAKEVKSLTKAEYDALEEKEQNVIYSVIDGEGDSATTSIWLNGELLNYNAPFYVSHNNTFYINAEIGTDYFDFNSTKDENLYLSKDFSDNNLLKYTYFTEKYGSNAFILAKISIQDNSAYYEHIISDYFIIYTSSSSAASLYPLHATNYGKDYTVSISQRLHPSPYLYCYMVANTQSNWNETNTLSSSFIRNKPNILKGYGEARYMNQDNGNIAVSTDSYIEICNWFDSISAPHGAAPFTTTLYVGRHTNSGTGDTTTGSSESYCFSISFDSRLINLDSNNTHPTHIVSVTQLNGSYTGLQKFTKLRIQVVNNYGYSVRLYYKKPSKRDTIKVLAIGESNVIDKITVPNYSLGSTPSLYFDYDLTPGFKVWKNNDSRIDSNKDITDVVYSSESKNALTDKSKSTFYTFTNYRNAISDMEDTGKVVGSGSDQKRIYKHTMTSPIEFEVGDVMIIPYIPGYKDGKIYGNRLVKITSITNKENNYVIEGYPLNPVPTEYSENRMPDIGKVPVDVDYVIPVEENITATLKNSIISTAKPSHYWDWWIDNAPTNFYDSSSDYIIEGTNVSKFKKGDIIIIPSLTGSYQHVHSGNLLAEILYVYNDINNNAANTRIIFHIINYDFNDETGNYVDTSLNNIEIKLYARL